MNLPKSLTTITTISKIVALIMFVALPFIGILIGYNYSQSICFLK